MINNGNLGMVRQWQTLFYDERYSNTDLHRPSGSPTSSSSPRRTAASACAARGRGRRRRINKAMEINDTPVVIDFVVHEDAMVWPMVAGRHQQRRHQFARDMAPDVGR